MILSDETESRAVVRAVQGAVGQARLDAGVNMTGLLIDIDSAAGMDFRRHFMCWQLTRVLRPSLTELVPLSVVRRVTCKDLPPVQPHGDTVSSQRECFTAV
jgi:hypothetical protein